MLVGGCELVRRTLAETKDQEIREFLTQALPELEEDCDALARLIRSLGRAPNMLKRQLAWTVEKLGRFKLNGALTGHSPLSRLVELEGVVTVLGASEMVWRSLSHAGAGDRRPDAAARAARAAEQLARLQPLRLDVADVVFSGGDRRL